MYAPCGVHSSTTAPGTSIRLAAASTAACSAAWSIGFSTVPPGGAVAPVTGEAQACATGALYAALGGTATNDQLTTSSAAQASRAARDVTYARDCLNIAITAFVVDSVPRRPGAGRVQGTRTSTA
ncbi:hypothetical protein Cme02nite_36080 [Catellatospora methionotrophica]|uniref:Uncharacterized protein n=1 Tax=Catellatospora methionotrophica TaxID=121620 RepID=A0A8J3LHI0_9ACTN|nr:hypothetical protein Cme02nite_36080 [Catellatospora methionotrophica]